MLPPADVLVCVADLKPENFLLKTRDGRIDKDNLRAVDFGLSTFFQDGQVAKEVVGCALCHESSRLMTWNVAKHPAVSL